MPSAPARSHNNGSFNRVRLHAAARLSQRRDVIDVDVEALPDHVMGLEDESSTLHPR